MNHDEPMNENQFLLYGAKAELQIQCRFSDLLLQSREIENQTQVDYLGRTMQLWEALKGVTEGCFALWSNLSDGDRDAFIREALAAKEHAADEGVALVMAALNNPLPPKAIARTMLLGHNFLRTLDICLEALLRYPSQKSLTRKPLKTQVAIDWAVGGIREWSCNYPYSFEVPSASRKQTQRLAHVQRHYSTDRSIRSQISHKQIANMFMLRDTTVADLERRALAQLRAQLEDEPSKT
jgi:hypothetical protein